MTRTAVVTGGASGIGRSVCLQLARLGNAVVVTDINSVGAKQVADEIVSTGAQAIACQLDVGDRDQVDDAIRVAQKEFGPVSILVHSAAVSIKEPFLQMSVDSWQRVIDINLTGTFHVTQAVLPEMVDAGWGRIVLISSSSAQRGAPGMAHYAASKGGMIALTKTLALEFASTGVTVNNIAPSAIDTPMVRQQQAVGAVSSSEMMARAIPVGRMGTGEDIAAAAGFLCSAEAAYITGQTVSVNGGSFVG